MKKVLIAILTLCVTLSLSMFVTVSASATHGNDCEYDLSTGVCSCGEVALEMEKGASAKLTGSPLGMRFKTNVDKTYLDKVDEYAVQNGYQIEVGTLVIPTDLLGENEELTLSTQSASVGYALGGDAELSYITLDETNGEYNFTGVLNSIKDGNVAREYTGRGFVRVINGDNEVFTVYAKQNDNSRSVFKVISAHVADSNKLGVSAGDYANGIIETALTKIVSNNANANLSVSINGTIYANGDTLTVKNGDILNISASFGEYDCIPVIGFENTASSLAISYQEDSYTSLSVSGKGKGELTFTIGEYSLTVKVTTDFSVLEVVKNSGSEDISITQEVSEVTEIKGKTGNFTKNIVTMVDGKNANFILSGYFADDYDNYAKILEENPNATVEFYVYFDMSNTLYNGTSNWSCRMNFISDMFDFSAENVRNGNGDTAYYDYSVSQELSTWLTNNYTDGVFNGKNIFKFYFANGLNASSGITCYYSFSVKVPEPIDYTLDFEIYAGVTQDDVSQTISTVTEVNGNTGEFVKNEIVFAKEGNGKFTLSGSVIDDYQKYTEILANNLDAQVKFYCYFDMNNTVTKQGWAGRMYFASPLFGQGEVLKREGSAGNYYYEYSTTVALSTWLESSYTDGVFNGSSLLSFRFENPLKAESGITLYFSFVVE